MARTRNFPCPWNTCKKAFNRKSDLCRHYRIHTNERPYRCNFPNCAKSFIQRSALTVHSRTHTGEKPHVCDYENCHKAFSDSSSLARHRRIHTGRRPYKCLEPACERSFCRKTTLTKHQHRSHRHDQPSQPTPSSPEEQIYTQHSPDLLPSGTTYPEPLYTPPAPTMITQVTQEYFSPQPQPTVLPVSVPGEPTIIHPEANYVGNGAVYAPPPPPQMPLYGLVNHTIDPTHRYSAAPPVSQRIIPTYDARLTLYHDDMDAKPMVSRMFNNPYQERVNWDFLGLES